MQTIKTGADYSVLNTAREELTRVWKDMRWSRTPESQDSSDALREATSFGEIAEAFKNAEEAVFNAINVASSHDDPQAKEAIASVGPGLTAIAASEMQQQETQV